MLRRGLAPVIADTPRERHPMNDVPSHKRCDCCNHRVAIYRSKKRTVRSGTRKGMREQVCATCMKATWSVFGDQPRDYTRITEG